MSDEEFVYYLRRVMSNASEFSCVEGWDLVKKAFADNIKRSPRIEDTLWKIYLVTRVVKDCGTAYRRVSQDRFSIN